jgi:1,4-dihydroxy-2-naphthoate polyprenyltransferase
VFLNDWFDFDSDRLNRHGGPFTGGSRVLVDGRLDRAAMRKGIVLSILGAAGALAGLVAMAPAASTGSMAAIYALLALLALAYTVPPLKLSHRGFGEVDVALTHSAGAIMAGYVAQGGHWADSHAVAAGAAAGPGGAAVDPARRLPRPGGRRGSRQAHAGGHARATRCHPPGDGSLPGRTRHGRGCLALARTDMSALAGAGAPPAARCMPSGCGDVCTDWPTTGCPIASMDRSSWP